MEKKVSRMLTIILESLAVLRDDDKISQSAVKELMADLHECLKNHKPTTMRSVDEVKERYGWSDDTATTIYDGVNLDES